MLIPALSAPPSQVGLFTYRLFTYRLFTYRLFTYRP
jgi:hypothetical protein